jgi:hypothetical protein
MFRTVTRHSMYVQNECAYVYMYQIVVLKDPRLFLLETSCSHQAGGYSYFMFMYMHSQPLFPSLCMHTHVWVCVCACVCTHVYVCACVCA